MIICQDLMKCCGIVGGMYLFHNNEFTGPFEALYNGRSPADGGIVNKGLQESIEQWHIRIEGDIRKMVDAYRTSKPFFLIFLNKFEYDSLHCVFERNGWEILKEGLNRNSANMIRIYCYDNSKYETPPWHKPKKADGFSVKRSIINE